MNGRFQRGHGHVHVGRIGRDAMFARPENGQPAIHAIDRRATEPGSRLLHGIAVSRKYMQRVRCSRLPAVVAMFRSCTVAPLKIASERTV